MGMYCHFYRLPPEHLQEMLDDSDVADAFFGYDIDEDDNAAWATHDAFVSQLRKSGRYLDIQRAWHCLHFLLTGKEDYDAAEDEPPPYNMIMGGTETDWEAYVGFYRYFLPEEVKEISKALKSLSCEALRRYSAPEAFNSVKLYAVYGEVSKDDIEPLFNTLDQVIAFYHAAAEAGDAVIAAVT